MVPTTLHKPIVEDFHQRTHRGPEASKKLLKELYHWSLMREMVDSGCKDCMLCTKYSPSKPEEPSMTIDEDDIHKLKPMEKISVHLFYIDNEEPNLCVVNKYSGYIMWKPLSGETTDNVVKALNKIFVKKVKTDNRPCFWNSFKRMMDDLGIIHSSGSAHNHQSQGQVECAILMIKTIYQRLSKEEKTSIRIQHAVMSMNCMQITDNSGSPSHMFFGRDVRINKFGQLNNKVAIPSLTANRQAALTKMRARTEGNRKIGQFFPGDHVFIQNMKTKVFNMEEMTLRVQRWDNKKLKP